VGSVARSGAGFGVVRGGWRGVGADAGASTSDGGGTGGAMTGTSTGGGRTEEEEDVLLDS